MVSEITVGLESGRIAVLLAIESTKQLYEQYLPGLTFV